MSEQAVNVSVNQIPIKGVISGQAIDFEGIQAQAALNRRNLVPVDYTKIPGTCPDERPHDEDPRPAVWGGPDVYGLAITELTGQNIVSNAPATERLLSVKSKINDANIISGGHIGCAANKSFVTWIKSIAEATDGEQLDQTSAVVLYTKSELGDAYDEAAMLQVAKFAGSVVAGEVYEYWDESNLAEVLKDEPGSIETLAAVDHEGITVGRNRVDGYTIDQTKVYQGSVAGKGTFDMDDWYAGIVETAVTAGDDQERLMHLARHAREAITAAVAGAVPNPLLFEITLKA